MNYKKELLNFMVGCLIGVPFFGYSHLLSELPPYLDQNTHNFLDEIIFFPCEFEEIPLDLKNHAIDFECHDNLFLVEELIGKSTRGKVVIDLEEHIIHYQIIFMLLMLRVVEYLKSIILLLFYRLEGNPILNLGLDSFMI